MFDNENVGDRTQKKTKNKNTPFKALISNCDLDLGDKLSW
jgi:hypothetical protein